MAAEQRKDFYGFRSNKCSYKFICNQKNVKNVFVFIERGTRMREMVKIGIFGGTWFIHILQ